MSGCLWLPALLLIVYVVLLFLCFAVSLLSLISHLNVLYMFFIVFYSYSCDSFLFDTKYSWPHFPGVSFGFGELIPIRIKKKCMNCLEIYLGLHVLMFAYSHLSAYKTFLPCISYFAFPLFCCVIIVLHFTFKCFVYAFHCLLFIFMWFFF